MLMLLLLFTPVILTRVICIYSEEPVSVTGMKNVAQALQQHNLEIHPNQKNMFCATRMNMVPPLTLPAARANDLI